MSSELVVITPKSIEEAERMSKMLALSQLLPDALKQKPADVLSVVLAGAELGLAPMQAIRGLVVIKGKPTLSADTMGALVKRRGDVCEYLVLKETTGERATYETKRKGDPTPTTMTFTAADAQRAGLNGDNWRKYPAAMLRARCLAAICRAVYPDLCLGLYDPDELASEGLAPGPSAPPASVEKDVTPAPTAAPKTANEAKAQLAAKVATLNGAVTVDAPKKSRMHVEDVSGKPPPVNPHWTRILAIASEHGMSKEATQQEMKSRFNKTKPGELTEADVTAFQRWADDSDIPFPSDPPPNQEPAPF